MDGGQGWHETGPVATHPLPRWTADATVAMVVRHYAPRLMRQLEGDAGELLRLQTGGYSLAVFGLGVPFLQHVDDLSAALATRYWPTEFPVRRERYRITSQWQERHRSRLIAYLTGRRDVPRPAVGARPPAAMRGSDIAFPAFAEEARPFEVPGARPGSAGGDEAVVRRLLEGLAPLPPAGAAEDTPAVRAAYRKAAAELRALAARTAAELAAAREADAGDARRDGTP